MGEPARDLRHRLGALGIVVHMLEMAGIALDAGEDEARRLRDLPRERHRRLRRKHARAPRADIDIDQQGERLAGGRLRQRRHRAGVVGDRHQPLGRVV